MHPLIERAAVVPLSPSAGRETEADSGFVYASTPRSFDGSPRERETMRPSFEQPLSSR